MGYGNKSISDWQRETHEISKANGFYESPPSFTDRMVLIHSEVSEAVEWYREYPENMYPYYECTHGDNDRITANSECLPLIGNTNYRLHKPLGIPSEMADIVIRVMDFCEYVGINLEYAIRDKMAYNKTRSYRHGGKAL